MAGLDHVIDYPSSAEHAGDLPPDLDRLRRQAPLARVRLADGRTAWLVTRYDDVRTVLSGENFTRDTARGDTTTRTVNMDGRPHQELRNLVTKAFTVRQIDRMRPRIQELTDDLLDAMEDQGPPADVVRCLAAPLPAIVMCELLGFPVADHEKLARWCERITSVGNSAGQAWVELGAYVERAADEERGNPTDLIGVLVRARDEETLTRAELVSLVIVILAGGLETTRTAISAGLLRLFRTPNAMRELGTSPALLDRTIEELLRYQPIIDLNRVQVATADVRLGDQLVRAGDLVQVSINAANRDDDVFPDGARFEMTRDPNPHLAFGFGAHHCLGAALARVELRTAFATILRRLPNLRPAVAPESLSWQGGHVTVGLPELPVTW